MPRRIIIQRLRCVPNVTRPRSDDIYVRVYFHSRLRSPLRAHPLERFKGVDALSLRAPPPPRSPEHPRTECSSVATVRCAREERFGEKICTYIGIIEILGSLISQISAWKFENKKSESPCARSFPFRDVYLQRRFTPRHRRDAVVSQCREEIKGGCCDRRRGGSRV